jgi:hypothetical protein
VATGTGHSAKTDIFREIVQKCNSTTHENQNNNSLTYL